MLCLQSKQLKEVFARFGLLSQIVIDNGAQFMSKEFAALYEKQNQSTSSSFHPAANSAVENFVKTLKTILAKMMKNPKNSVP